MIPPTREVLYILGGGDQGVNTDVTTAKVPIHFVWGCG
jgi:hypothetical protein